MHPKWFGVVDLSQLDEEQKLLKGSPSESGRPGLPLLNCAAPVERQTRSAALTWVALQPFLLFILL